MYDGAPVRTRNRHHPATIGQHMSAARTVTVPARDHHVAGSIPEVGTARRADVSLFNHNHSGRRRCRPLVMIVNGDGAFLATCHKKGREGTQTHQFSIHGTSLPAGSPQCFRHSTCADVNGILHRFFCEVHHATRGPNCLHSFRFNLELHTWLNLWAGAPLSRPRLSFG